MMNVASLLLISTLGLASPEPTEGIDPTDKTHETVEPIEAEPSPSPAPAPVPSPPEGATAAPTGAPSALPDETETAEHTASDLEASTSGTPAAPEPLSAAPDPSATHPPRPGSESAPAESTTPPAPAATEVVADPLPSPSSEPSSPPPAQITVSPDWIEALVAASASDPAPTVASPALMPLPGELMARGPAVAARRFLWFLATMLLSQLSLRVASRRPRGPLRLFLVRIVALSRALAALALLGTVLALLPTRWLPWVGIIAASAAVAVGWSLRPILSDGLSGLYLGIIGRHSPGTLVQMPDIRGIIHTPGPFRTVVRTESGALRTVPNRQLVTESREAALDGRTAITVQLNLPGHPTPRVGLAAIQWACTLLPWTGEEPAKVRPPTTGATPEWTVEMVVLGDAPPVAEIRAVFFDLVIAILDRSTADSTDEDRPTDSAPSTEV